MCEHIFKAWSNGQWISLDLNLNRYIGGEIKLDPSLQAEHFASVAMLHDASGDEKPLIVPADVVANYIRYAWIAHKVRNKAIREQLRCMRVAVKSTGCIETSTQLVSWHFQYLRNLRISRPSCLEDSITCALFTKHYLTRASFCVGVRRPPFAAHAWVRVGNVLINDVKGAVEGYSEILRLDI